MDSNDYGDSRGSAGFDILIAISGGVLLGLASYFLKIGLNASALLPDLSIVLLVLNPVIILAAILSLSGFFLIQRAMHKGHLSIVVPVSAGLGIVVPIVLAYLFLGEFVVFEKGLGIVLIILGISILGKRE